MTPPRYTTVAELRDAYASGVEMSPLTIDNDYTAAHIHDADWIEVEKVFEMHPAEVLEEALTLLGIPWEHV